jgi:2-keto-4-pentenoate hydratase
VAISLSGHDSLLNYAALAARMLDDYDRHDPGTIFKASPSVGSVEDAYALQFAVARLREARGEAIAGYKIGCVSAVMQKQLGLDRPVFGHVFASELHSNHATLDHRQYAGLAIEGEFAMRLGPAPALFPVIELHNYRFRNSPHTAQELIANNAIHAGVVLPAPEVFANALANPEIEVRINGESLGKCTADALPGGPFESLRLLEEHLAIHSQTLRPGQIVLTGSPLPLFRAKPGDRIDVHTSFGVNVSARVSLVPPTRA